MATLDIGVVAQRSGLKTSTLRYYEQKGLIRSIGRAGLRRQFHHGVLEQLAFIQLGQSAGLSLDDIAGMFDQSGLLEIDRPLLLEKVAEIEKAIHRLVAIKENLVHVVHCPKARHVDCPSFQKLLHPDVKTPSIANH